MARPKTGREFIVKIAVDEQTYLDLLAYRREYGMSSISMAGFKALKRHFRGHIASLPSLLVDRRTSKAESVPEMACNE